MFQYRTKNLPPHRQLRMGVGCFKRKSRDHAALDGGRLADLPLKRRINRKRPLPVTCEDFASGFIKAGFGKIELLERRRICRGACLTPREELILGKARLRSPLTGGKVN